MSRIIPGRYGASALLMLVCGCLDEPAGEEVGQSAAALTPVTWTDVVGVSAVGNDLTKTAPEMTWHAGAVSVESLAGDGFVEFSTDEHTLWKAAGLSNGNGGQNYTDIDFAIRLSNTGRVTIYEAGVRVFAGVRYGAHDYFRVQVDGGVVSYWRNGRPMYVSSATATFPLVVDTSIRDPGATITNVLMEHADFWTAPVGVVVDGDDITKTAPEDSFNAGAVSVESISGADGYVEFTAADATTVKAAGLSSGNSDQRLGDIDFAIYLSAVGGVSIWEAGTKIGNFGKYTAGDTFQVAVSGGAVEYYRNGLPIYTSLAAPTFPLLLDTALKTPGASLLDAHVKEPGVLGTGCVPLQQSFLGAQAGERLGLEIAAAGDVMVTKTDNQSNEMRVYRKGSGGWAFDQSLFAREFDAVAVTDGQTIVIGGNDSRLDVYRYDGAAWVLDGTINLCSWVGPDISVSGDVIATRFGGAHLYRRGPSGWQLDGVLHADSGIIDEVAVAGTWAFLAADFDDTMGDRAGAIQVFRYHAGLPDPPVPVSCSNPSTGKWRPNQNVYAPDAAPLQRFPGDIDVNAAGNRLIATSPGTHAAYIFDLAGGVWSATAELTPYPFTFDFPSGVALGGPRDSVAVVGTQERRYDVRGDVFVFAEGGSAWQQIDYLPEQNGASAATSDTIFLGNASNDDAGENAGVIRVHGIERTCLPE